MASPPRCRPGQHSRGGHGSSTGAWRRVTGPRPCPQRPGLCATRHHKPHSTPSAGSRPRQLRPRGRGCWAVTTTGRRLGSASPRPRPPFSPTAPERESQGAVPGALQQSTQGPALLWALRVIHPEDPARDTVSRALSPQIQRRGKDQCSSASVQHLAQGGSKPSEMPASGRCFNRRTEIHAT